MDHVLNFFGRDGLLQAHDIVKGHSRLRASLNLDLIRRMKVHQTILSNDFRQMISRFRNHSISNDRSFTRHANIGSPCSHVNQSHIEASELLGNRHANRRNRLQGQIRHMQPRPFTSRIQTVHHILWKKGGNDIHACL